MNAADKETWVAALRSGDYKQGRGRLCRDDKFCCLGVAFDVLADSWWSRSGNLWGAEGNFSFWFPPGVSSKDAGRLAQMNDAGDSFAQIADWIEANL